MKFPHMLGSKSLTVVVDGVPYHVTRPTENDSKERWQKIKDALNDDATTRDEMIALLSPKEAVTSISVNVPAIQLRGNQLYYNEAPVHNALSSKIVDIIQEGLDVKPWIRFAENVYANPNQYSREELYLFLEKADLPITDDGCFLAYKNVRGDYRDIYSGSFDNSVGQVVEMPRNNVDTNRDNTCSVGLHFASKEYLPHYRGGGSRTMIVKINPADVVSIPSDYDNTKGRTWRYEVVGEIAFEQVQQQSWPAIYFPSAAGGWDFDFDDDDDYDTVDIFESDAVTDPADQITRIFSWFRRNN
jgi:hypothetical protein